MQKPTTKTRTYWDYREVIDYIEKTKNIKERNFEEHQDFWHWVLDKSYNDIHNGCYINFVLDNPKAYYENLPQWVETILGYIKEVVDNSKSDFWVEW